MHEGTKETTPFHIWKDAVLTAAAATNAEAEPYRERILRWYQAGEPAWMAGDSLKAFVRGARKAANEPDDLRALRRVLLRTAEKQ
jgi:hypothetical protein